ncbi:hypothetical protein ACI797_10790 [Geodermatophilus sp. SYSU D00691]
MQEWLHLHTEALQDIRKHTRLLYVIGIIWLVLFGLGVVFWICAAIIAASI